MSKHDSPESRAATRNKFLAVIAYTVRTVALMFASGTLIQTLLGVMGFSSRMIYIHSTLLQSSNILSIVLFSRMAKGSGKTVIRRAAFTAIPTGLLFLTYIPFLSNGQSSIKIFICLAAIAVIQQVFIGFYTVYEYKTPYFVYRSEEYGRMLALCGIISSVASLLAGTAVSYLSAKYSYLHIMEIGFIISALLMVIAFVSTFFQKDISGGETLKQTPETSRLGEIIRYPAFYKLIPANLLRGFSMGALGVLAATALDMGYNETLTATMVVIQSVASLASCAYLAVKPKSISYGTTLLLASVLVATTPLLMIKGEYIFLGLYALIIFGKTTVDYAVPSLLRQIVPVDKAAPYNAWRMVLTNLGVTAATALAAVMSIPVLLIATAACQLIAGILYYIEAKN